MKAEEMRLDTMKPKFQWVAEYLKLPDLALPVAKYSYLFNNTMKKSGKHPKYRVTWLSCYPKSKFSTTVYIQSIQHHFS